jgi:hypothetical protein
MKWCRSGCRPVLSLFLGAVLGCVDGSGGEKNRVESQGGAVAVDSSVSLTSSPVAQNLLYRAASANGLRLESEMEVLVLQYREALLGNLFLEHYMSSRVSVTMDEIRDHYVTNRPAYQRRGNQVRVLHFLLADVDKATSVKVALLQYDAAVRSSLLEEHAVVPSTVSPGDMPTPLDALLFGDSPPRGVLGPIGTQFGFHVIEVLEFFPKNSFRGLDEVYDEISQNIYRTKRGALYSHLMDSLSRAYPGLDADGK